MDNRPIGIFDSGVGGLTVVKEVIEELPNEKIIYFGDTARVPYGSKSKDTVTKFSKQIIRYLLTKNVKAIIIACNTASSNSLEEVQKEFDIPIIGVVEPGVSMACKATKSNKVGIIGTESTIRSSAYNKMIKEQNENISVIGKACPLFVPLVEEGWFEEDVTLQIVTKYLNIFKKQTIDTLVLGCTHYPLIANVIQKAIGNEVTLVNPAKECSKALKRILNDMEMNSENQKDENEFYVSDRVESFERLAKMILEKPLMAIEQINIEEY